MRSSLRWIVVISAVVAAFALGGGTAFGVGAEASHDSVRAPSSDAVGSFGRLGSFAVAASSAAQEAGDRYLGLGGVRPGPLPVPTPTVHPEGIVNLAIETVAQAAEEVGRGLGGVGVGPIPAPTPVVQPDPDGRTTRIVNATIQRVGKTLEDVGRGLGGVGVGPIPAPTPIVIPAPEVS